MALVFSISISISITCNMCYKSQAISEQLRHCSSYIIRIAHGITIPIQLPIPIAIPILIPITFRILISIPIPITFPIPIPITITNWLQPNYNNGNTKRKLYWIVLI